MNGSAVGLSFYNNILSTVALVPMVVVAGELPGAISLLSDRGAANFVWGAAVTVSDSS